MTKILKELIADTSKISTPRYQDRRASDKIEEETASQKLLIKKEILRKTSSHSCEDLTTLTSSYNPK